LSAHAPLRNNLHHDLIGIVDGLRLETASKGERVDEVARIGGSQFVAGHRANLAEQSEQRKN